MELRRTWVAWSRRLVEERLLATEESLHLQTIQSKNQFGQKQPAVTYCRKCATNRVKMSSISSALIYQIFALAFCYSVSHFTVNSHAICSDFFRFNFYKYRLIFEIFCAKVLDVRILPYIYFVATVPCKSLRHKNSHNISTLHMFISIKFTETSKKTKKKQKNTPESHGSKFRDA